MLKPAASLITTETGQKHDKEAAEQTMDYKMIVLDLDGTLTNREKKISPRTRDALMEAQKRGKIVVLASGRPTQGVVPLAKELELGKYGSYILSFNGGLIINCSTGRAVVSALLPLSINRRVVELAEEHRVNILTYEGDSIITLKKDDQYVELEAGVNHMNVREIKNMGEYVEHLQVPKFLMVDDEGYLSTVEPKVKAALGRDFSVYRSEPFFLEILPKGIDKAQRLEMLLGILGISREEIIACGDGYNDLTMIKYAGLGVAMENAVFSVRKAADYITASNNEDGVALVVEKFLLS